MFRRSCSMVFLFVALAVCRGDEDVRFRRDVRPLLADHCFRCHGPDAATRRADLRLDTREGLFGEGSDGAIVVPNDPLGSELVRRITSHDPDVRMPPEDAKKPLTPQEIELLRRWVAEGAAWEGHWSFTPPKRPAVPGTRPSEEGEAIDRFIETRLASEGIAPLPRASRETLIRRVSLDLVGLPPRPQEVHAFLADDSPDAYERLVDRLLASPRYGERMAVDWLDAARYADTSGYQNDGPRDMWRWRDWVIDAYNANQPFDEFTLDQIAGDLRPHATLEQVIATGFNRNHRGNSEGGIVPEEYAVEYVVDRVDTTATVWLGLTLGCARCHDHKYDPVSQREYYRLFDYFNDVPENGRSIKEGNSPPFVVAPTAEQARRLREWERELVLLDETLDKAESDPAHLEINAAWEGVHAGPRRIDWTVTEGLVARFPFDGTLENRLDESQPTFEILPGEPRPMDDAVPNEAARFVGDDAEFVPFDTSRSVRLTGNSFVDAGNLGRFGYRDPFTVSTWIRPAKSATGGIVTRMTDDSDRLGWALHLERGRIQVNLVKRWLDDSIRVDAGPLEPEVWQHVSFTYDGSRRAEGVVVRVNGEPRRTRILHDFLNQTFECDEPLRIGSTGTEQRIEAEVADARVYERALDPDEAAILATIEPLNVIAEIPVDRRTRGQRAKVFAATIRTWAPVEARRAWFALRQSEQDLTGFEASLPTVMVMQQTEIERPSFVLRRGEYDKPGEMVAAGVPAVLAAATGSDPGQDRLGLAEWIVDPWNPLTARVAVNREWQRFFGRGIVETAEDFGTQGAPPSHPELLDWLATEFVRTGWDVKRLQRLIVTSAAYCRSSRVTPELLERDPENRLLARGPRFRLPAEVVRDQALAAAGLLVERIGGPSVKPYQPDGLWAEIATDKTYDRASGPDLHRRSVYSYKKRTVANPTMGVFDAATREFCLVRRGRTNTPLQALALMNDVTFVEAARVLAERSLRGGFDDERDRAEWMFRRVLARPPDAGESGVLSAALARHRDSFRADAGAVRALVSVGESAVDPSLDGVDLAAHAAVASLILNLDEAVTRP